MPRGIYPRTEEHKKKLSEAHKGKRGYWKEKKRPEHSKFMSQNHPLKDKHHSEETKRKISKGIEGKTTGEKQWNWKGGITQLKRRIRAHYKYRQWRSDVFTRDDFVCQICGVRGIYLEADHYPKMFSTIFHENKIKSLEKALNCEEFWNINNGRTLCRKCHMLKDGRLF